MTRKRIIRYGEPVPESAVLRGVLQRLRVCHDVAWCARMNVGAYHITEDDGRSRFVRHGFPGLSDIIGQLRDGRILAVECKSESGRLTQKQQAFLEMVRRYNGVAGVARGLEDVEELIR